MRTAPVTSGPLWAETPQGLQRLVLLLYGLVGVPLAGLLYASAPPVDRGPAIVAVASFIVSGGAWVALRKPRGWLGWVYPVAVVPTVCCGIAFMASPSVGAAFLGIVGAPLAWAAILMDTPVVLAAWALAVATSFAALQSRGSILAAAGGALLMGAVHGLVAWVVHSKAVQLRRLCARDRALVEAIPDVLARADGAGRILDVRAPPGEFLPAAAEDLVGRSVAELVPLEVAAQVRSAIHTSLASGTVQMVEYQARYGDSLRAFEARFAPCGADEVITIWRDITMRREAQAEHDLLATLIGEMQDSVIVTDTDFRIRRWSGASARMYGWSEAEVIGRPVPEVLQTVPEACTHAELLERLTSGTPVTFRGRDLCKSGVWLPTTVDVTPLRDRAGRVTGLLAVARDITRELTADRALREAEERNRSVIAAAGEGIVMRSADGSIPVYNRAAESLLGVSARQMEGIDPAPTAWHTLHEDGSLLPPEERPNRVALRTGRPVANFVMGIHKSDGSETWVSVNVQPLFREAQSTPHAVVAVYRDVTQERKQAQELRRGREQLALALEGSMLGSWEWHLPSDHVTYSPLWPALLGYGIEEMQPTYKAWASLVHRDDVQRVDSQLVAHLKGQVPGLDVEYRMRARDGTWRWIQTRGRAVEWDAGGRVVRIVGTHGDITSRRNAEDGLRDALAANKRLLAELRQGEERLRLALTAGNHTEWDYDVARDRLTFGLGAGAFPLGGPAEGISARDWREQVHPDDRARAWTAVADCVAGDTEHYESEYRLRTAAGLWRWVRSRGRVTARDAFGKPLLILGTATDVTELHDLQERVLAAARLASVGTLAAGVAHEINNPLAWLTANLAYAQEHVAPALAGAQGTPGGELVQLLDEMRAGAERIAVIVRAMRTLGRPEHPEEVREVDLRQEIEGVIHMVRAQVVQRARLVVDVPGDLPPIRTTTSELGRVFVNLLANAAQAVPSGRAAANEVRIAARPVDEGVIVEISDTGQGMSREVQRRVFEPFFTTKPVGQGTGLGLAIAKSILDGAGGRIEFESKEGRGTLFRVHLPSRPGGEQV